MRNEALMPISSQTGSPGGNCRSVYWSLGACHGHQLMKLSGQSQVGFYTGEDGRSVYDFIPIVTAKKLFFTRSAIAHAEGCNNIVPLPP